MVNAFFLIRQQYLYQGIHDLYSLEPLNVKNVNMALVLISSIFKHIPLPQPHGIEFLKIFLVPEDVKKIFKCDSLDKTCEGLHFL